LILIVNNNSHAVKKLYSLTGTVVEGTTPGRQEKRRLPPVYSAAPVARAFGG
jgi:hypothetical protein